MKAKGIISLVLAIALVAFALVGCGGGNVPDNAPNNGNNANNGNEPQEPEVMVGKLGLGVVNSIAKSKDYAPAEGDKAEVLAVGQVDTVMAAVLFDADGKVLKVEIDNAQTRVQYDAGMKVTNKDGEFKTKAEKGDDYGMKKASGIGKEWYEQINALEDWMVGKTVAEIKALKVKVVDDAHQNVPDVPELTSLVTITVESYIKAVEKAYASAIDVEGAEKLGLGHKISIGRSKDYAPAEGDKAEVLPLAQVDTTMAATAFDADGKVVGTLIDNAQIRVQFSADGKVTTDKTAALKTKVEKGDEYGMKKVSGIGKEWYEQITALGDWMVGKTVDEIKALKVKVVDDAHQNVPDVPELTSSVTITVESYLAVVAEAYANAK